MLKSQNRVTEFGSDCHWAKYPVDKTSESCVWHNTQKLHNQTLTPLMHVEDV